MIINDYIHEHFNERVLIPIKDIKLTERLHKHAKHHPPKKNYLDPESACEECREIVKIHSNPEWVKHKTLIVRDLGDGKYGLVTGWNAYTTCRFANKDVAYCLVINEDRRDFVSKYGECEKKIKNIKVPAEFRETPPKAEKLQFAKNNIKNGTFRPLLISADGYLLDGYTRYLAAKELGMMTVPVNHSCWNVKKNGGELLEKKGRKRL